MDITSERLHIRDFASEDWLALHALRIDPAVYRYNHFDLYCNKLQGRLEE